MVQRQPTLIPRLWLVSDARNDARVERALARMPRGSGLIVRHYHLAPPERRARFDVLARAARARGHVVVLAGPAEQARAWGADGAYGRPGAGRGGLLGLATAHSLREVARARLSRADAVLLSPVFPTRSHPGGQALGPVRWRLLAARGGPVVIALGGMNRRGAARLRWDRWAAIDGLGDGLA